ncbi:MAG: DUF892 family protein [Limisphaerales bacterium]
MTQNKDLIHWLNDAYSMELSLEETLQHHIKDLDEHPQMKERLEQHVLETRRHANDVKQCIEALGGKVSRTKAIFADLMGRFQGMSTGMFSDEIIKNLLHEHASENFEIASYESLAAAAEDLGEGDVALTCRRILEDERRMASWVLEQIPIATKQYLHGRMAHA